MTLVIHLGLHAFTRDPEALLPEAPLTLSELKAEGSDAQADDATLLLEELTSEARETLQHWLAQTAHHRITMAWPQPQAFLAASLNAGKAPARVLQQWLAQAEQVLALFRHHRRQVTLVGVAPGASADDQPEGVALALPQPSALYQRLAAQQVEHNAALNETLAYLQASSQTFSVPTLSVEEGLEEALADIEALNRKAEEATRERDDAVNECQRQKEENQLLLDQLHNVQEELESLAAQHRKAEEAVRERDDAVKECQRLKEENQRQKEEMQPQTDEHRALEEENQLLLAQLHSVQEAFESHFVGQQERQQGESQSRVQQRQVHELKCLIGWLRAHAYRHAATAYRDSRRYKKALPEQIALLEASDIFDADWYRAQYRDLADTTMNLAEHFIKFGAMEGRNPGPRFDTEFYLIHHPDVAASGQHPLLHYLRDGINEERDTVASTQEAK